MAFFNTGDNLNGFCFTCLNANTGLCKKCMELFAQRSPPGRLVDDIEVDPHFRELWGLA